MAEDEVRLRYSGFVLFLSRLLSVGTGLLFVLMITRSITTDEYGIYGNISDVLAYFTLPSTIIPFWITRFTARKHPGSFKTGLATNFLLSTLFASIYMLLFPTVTSIFKTEAYMVVYAIVIIEILQLYSLRALEGTLQARKPQTTGYGFLIFEVCKVIVGFILIIQLQLGLLGAIGSVILAYIPQLIFYLKLTAHQLQEKIRWDYVKQWLKASPINLYNVAGQRLAAFPLILLFIYASELARAYYGASLTFANIIGYSSLLAFALYPKLLSKSDPEDVSVSLKMVFMFAIPMTAGAIALSDSYLTILQKVYRPARLVLMLLAVNALLTSLFSVFNSITSGTEKLDAKAKISFKKLIKSRLFLIFTLPYIQAVVAIPITYFTLTSITETAIEAATFLASINLATNIALLLASYAIAKKCLNFRIPWSNVAKYTGATAVMTLALLVLPHPTRLSLTLALTLLGGIIYLAVLLPIDKEARDIANSITQEMLRITRLKTR
jgi:O-antigen/teichoic acid export membrane protein